MENKNLDSAILITNIMMNVDRGLREIEPLVIDEPVFLENADADEYIEMATEFDFLKESFRIYEQRYKAGHYVNMMDLDMIANYLDLLKNYFESINKPF
jgi:hypothetical protein